MFTILRCLVMDIWKYAQGWRMTEYKGNTNDTKYTKKNIFVIKSEIHNAFCGDTWKNSRQNNEVIYEKILQKTLSFLEVNMVINDLVHSLNTIHKMCGNVFWVSYSGLARTQFIWRTYSLMMSVY